MEEFERLVRQVLLVNSHLRFGDEKNICFIQVDLNLIDTDQCILFVEKETWRTIWSEKDWLIDLTRPDPNLETFSTDGIYRSHNLWQPLGIWLSRVVKIFSFVLLVVMMAHVAMIFNKIIFVVPYHRLRCANSILFW